MATTPAISTKRVAINKANAQMVVIVAVASFITVFCLVAAKTVISQNSYQSRVTKGKEVAKKQLNDDAAAFSQLSSAYGSFNNTPTNIIGGSSKGSSDNDGNNAKIISDALPAKYNFPELTSSVEKLLTDRGFKIAELSGVDDQLNQQANLTSATPKPVAMPFTLSVESINYDSVGKLLTTLQNSVRPIQIDTLTLSGAAGDLKAVITAHTYYQPGLNFTITQKAQK